MSRYFNALTFVSAAMGISLISLSPAVAAGAGKEVKLENIAARVVVTPENRRDIDLKVAYASGNKLPQIMVRMEGNRLVADGTLTMRSLNCASDDTFQISGLGRLSKADLPTINLRVPMDAQIAVEGVSFGQIGVTSTLDFSQGGCGKWTLGNVDGKAEINIGGSGDVNAGSAKDLEVNIGGSGTYRGQAVANLEARIGGSGGIELARMSGKAEINIGGSGNVTIADGFISKLEANIAGSGGVRFGGEVKDVEVRIVGSGGVRVKKVSGRIERSIMGSGDLVIGQ